jgi:hypothetical protein
MCSAFAEFARNHAREAEEALDILLWGNLLSADDRETLRWWINYHGGLSTMITSIASLKDVSHEHDLLNKQMNVLISGKPATGDLSKAYRCGLTQQLVVGGVLALPVASAGGIATAVTTGALAGAAIASTGGIAAIGIIITALLWAKRYRC